MKSIFQSLYILTVLALPVAAGAQNKPDASIAPVPFVQDVFPSDYPQGVIVNSVSATDIKKPVTNPLGISGLSTADAGNMVMYSDGLGRPIQMVYRQSSPFYKDIVSYTFYDKNGRRTLQPLPVQSNDANYGGFKRNVFSFQPGFYSSTNHFNTALGSIADGDLAYPYSKITYDDQTLFRATHTYEPGAAKVGRNAGQGSKVVLNEPNDAVRIWQYTGAGTSPVSTLPYPNSWLIVTEVTDENGKRAIQYKDRDGKLILSKTEVSATTAQPGHSGWLCTYNIYDDYGRLRQVITPKAVDYLVQHNTWIIPASVMNELCYSYDYDNRNRIIYKKLPGQQPQQIVYDMADRQALVQDGNLAAANDWLFTKYDALGRVIITGKFLNSTGWTRSQLQDLITGASPGSNPFIVFMRTAVNNNTYTTASTVADAELYTISYFDNYANTPSGYSYAASIQPLLPTGYNTDVSALTAELKGFPTGGYTRIMDGNNVTGQWENTVVYYDQKGRILQSQSTNFKGGKDTVTLLYNFSGDVISTLAGISNPAAPAGQIGKVRIWNLNLYDAQGRLRQTTMKVNDEPYWRQINALDYDWSGALRKKGLGFSAELQEYRYRLWGALESINKNFCEQGGNSRMFGEVLNYEYGFSRKDKAMPSGMRWRLNGSNNIQRAYGYTYDAAGRLTQADYTQTQNGSNWDAAQENYTAGNMQYDANGNLMHMEQWGTNIAAGYNAPFKMDELNYVYRNNGASNQLNAVNDNIPQYYGLGEFKEPAGATTNDYGDNNQNYDANGNITKDANKEITGIDYTYFNKPAEIRFSNNRKIRFKYDVAGNTLCKEITENGATKYLDFLGGLEYENNALQSIAHAEGRVRPVLLTLNNNTTKWAYEYDFFIRDHQGNVRSTVTEEKSDNWHSYVATDPSDGAPRLMRITFNPEATYNVDHGYTIGYYDYLVTNELNNASSEESTFDKVDETRDTKPLSGDPDDQKATRLNAAENKVIGPSIMLRVMAGDHFRIKTSAYYESPEGEPGSGVTAQQLAGDLVNALSGAGGYQTINETGIGTDITYNAFTQSKFLTALQDVKNGQTVNVSKPQAFLNYIMLDDNLEVVEGNSGFVQTTDPDAWNQLSVDDMEIQRSGYIIAFLSNESALNVHFDNLELVHYKGKLLEENHYYPYGLTVTKKAAVQAPGNKNLFTSSYLHREEFANSEGLNWYDMGARMYDPQTGRWHSADILAESAANWSPYRYGFSNPVMFSDPGGMQEGDEVHEGDPDWDVEYEEAWFGGSQYHYTENGTSKIGDQDLMGLIAVGYVRIDPAYTFDMESLESDGDSWGGDGGSSGNNNDGWLPLNKPTLTGYISNFCIGCSTGKIQAITGNALENAWNESAQLIPGFIEDNYRPNSPSNKFKGGTRKTSPDGIADGRINTAWYEPDLIVEMAAWFEVKAMNGDIYNSTSTGQTMGHITNLAANVPYKYRHYGPLNATAASLTFVTTSEVNISPSVIATASFENIIIYQYTAQYKMIGPLMNVRFVLSRRNGYGFGGQTTPPVILKR